MKNTKITRVEGVIKTVTFHNPNNGFSVLKIQTSDAINPSLFKDEAEVITATGILIDPQKGEPLILEGTIETHPKFGRQLSFTSYQKETTFSMEGLVDYLASDLFPGVGYKTAEKIISTLGEKALEIIRQNPSVLAGIPGVSKKIQESLPNALIAHLDQEKMRVTLLGLGLTVGLIKMLIKIYQDTTIDKVTKRPYDLMKEVRGIGFERADQIAMQVGFEKNHPERLRAMVAYLFELLSLRQGHTHLPIDELQKRLYERLDADELGMSYEDAVNICEEAVQFGWLIQDETTYTLPLYQKAERTIANFMIAALEEDVNLPDNFETLLNAHLSTLEMTYTNEQHETLVQAFQSSVFMMTGGPGTGKTTLIKSIIALAKSLDYQVAAIAPTGKAARRLEAATGEKAYTIHRFLGIRPDGKPHYHLFQKAPVNFYIIDEISMVDVVLMATLIDAMKEGSKLILVGDEAQLPSVSPGQVLADLKTIVPHRTLHEIHRQAEASPIITLAESFRHQTYQTPWQHVPYLTMDKTQETESLKVILNLVKKFHQQGIFDIGILIPMYQGASGIDAVNTYLQTHLNPEPLVKLSEIAHYKKGDKVIQLSNNYDTLIMNGEMGLISAINPIAKTLDVQFEEALVTYQKEALKDLRLAYAISIHKSQGSGFDAVIMPLYKRFMPMLNRPLIYTGITRAKTYLTVLGDLDLIPYALKRNTHQRLTQLPSKLKNSPTQTEELSPYDFL